MFKELCANAVKKSFDAETQLWYKSPFILTIPFLEIQNWKQPQNVYTEKQR